MKKQDLVLAFFACLTLALLAVSCADDSIQFQDESDKDVIDKIVMTDTYEKGFGRELGPTPNTGYCVGTIERVDWVRQGEQDTYAVGETICVKCNVRQLDCRDAYRLRIWRDGLRMASVYIVSEESLCSECPKEALRVN